MRRFVPIIIALAIALPALTNGQTVTTVPVGFTTNAITPATDATHPASTVVAAPFYVIPSFQGAVSSVDSTNQLSVSGATFGDLTTTRNLARMKSGTSVGRFFLITANTPTQLTLDTATAGYTLTTGAPSNTQAQVSVGDSVEVLPANTLASLFGGTAATVPFQQGTSASQADNVYLYNATNQNWDIFYYNGTTGHWKQSGNLSSNLDNTVVYPDRGMFILRRATAALNLTFLGTVPSTTERTDFVGPASNFKTVRFPVTMTLAGAATSTTSPLNLQTLGGWLTGTSAGTTDNLYLYNTTNQNWDIFYYNGTTAHWKQSGNLSSNLDAQQIPVGTPIFVLRRSTAAGAASTFVQALPYSLL